MFLLRPGTDALVEKTCLFFENYGMTDSSNETEKIIRNLEHKLDVYMYGEKPERRGVLSRLAILELIEDRQRRTTRALATAVVAVIAERLLDIICRIAGS